MEVSEINRQSVTNSTNSLNSVLVVEDDPGMNKLVCRNLQKEGFTVQSALTAADALEIIYRDPGLLLILDYRLPDMTGTELIEKLKAEQYDMHFIVMTGFGDQKIAVEIMKLGARDYIVKDLDFIEHLPLLINRTLNR